VAAALSKKTWRQVKMDEMKILNRRYETVAWGLLAILWGITILFNFIPFGVGLLGTGLILLGVNLVRSVYNLPTRTDNTVFGILMLAWGGLELARPFLRMLFKSADLDWVIFAILLVGLGLILFVRGFSLSRNKPRDTLVNARKEN
jgi:hypothetical protein